MATETPMKGQSPVRFRMRWAAPALAACIALGACGGGTVQSAGPASTAPPEASAGRVPAGFPDAADCAGRMIWNDFKAIGREAGAVPVVEATVADQGRRLGVAAEPPVMFPHLVTPDSNVDDLGIQFAAVDAASNYADCRGSVEVLEGRFNRDEALRLASGPTGWATPPTSTVTGDAATVGWPAEQQGPPTRLHSFKHGGTLVVSPTRVAWGTEQQLTSPGNRPTWDAVGQQLSSRGAYSGTITDRGAWTDSGTPDPSKYSTAGVGSTPTGFVLVLLYPDATAAEASRPLLEERVRKGTRARSGQPWSSVFSNTSITATGSMVIMTATTTAKYTWAEWAYAHSTDGFLAGL